MKRLFVILLMLVCPILLYGQNMNLDKLSQVERDSILISIAEEYILKYAPDYLSYTDSVPVIERQVVTEAEAQMTRGGMRVGRGRYYVNYPVSKEFLLKYPYANPYTIQIRIWEDTGLIENAHFSGFGFSWPEGFDLNAELKDDDYMFVTSSKIYGNSVVQRYEYERIKRERGEKIPYLP